MSLTNAWDSSLPFFGGAGNGRDIGGVAEGGDWGRGGGIIVYLYAYTRCGN